MYLEKLNETDDIQQDITPTAEDDPIAITVTDRYSNTDLIKIDQKENTNQNTNNENALTTQKLTKVKTANPIIPYGNPITH